MQQRVNGASGSAAGTVNAGRLIKQARGIDGVSVGIDEIKKSRGASTGTGGEGQLGAGGKPASVRVAGGFFCRLANGSHLTANRWRFAPSSFVREP